MTVRLTMRFGTTAKVVALHTPGKTLAGDMTGVTPRLDVPFQHVERSAIQSHARHPGNPKVLNAGEWLRVYKNQPISRSLDKGKFLVTGYMRIDKILDVKKLHLRKWALKNGQADGLAPRTVIFGGKAAPGYAMAKRIIRLIVGIAEIALKPCWRA